MIAQDTEQYRERIGTEYPQHDCQLLIFNSAADRARSTANLSPETALCPPPGDCVAGIPSSVSSDEREAATLVLGKLVEAFSLRDKR